MCTSLMDHPNHLALLDTSEEEIELSGDEKKDIKLDPLNLQQCIANQGVQGQESPATNPLLSRPSSGIGLPASSTDGILVADAISTRSTEVSPEVADVAQSSSGVMSMSRQGSRQKGNEGSDSDSEFDDEFDAQLPVQNTGFVGLGRDIPDDDDLDEPARHIVNAFERAMDDEIDRIANISTIYEWQKDFDSFRAVPEQFSGPSPGPVKTYDTPYDAFIDIWSSDIIELIVVETNRYAKQTIEKAEGTLGPSSRLHKWKDTDADEIMVFFAMIMYMGIDHRSSIEEYWKSNDYLELSKFRELMSYNRYILLNKFLHFVDNSDVGQTHQGSEEFLFSPKLAKLAPVILHLNSKFSSLYNLHQNFSIDESLIYFKGHVSWVIRTKAARIGIKSYELCESQTGYMYKFQIYTGSGSTDSPASSVNLGSKTIQVVLGLLENLKHRGHCVTIGNFYNSPALARYVKSLGFDCLGTLRISRKNVPNDIARVPNSVAKGNMVARHCGDLSVLAWKDSRVVTIISTYHDNATHVVKRAGRTMVRPVCISDYNKTIGGVDLKDQKLSMYLLERKRVIKWYGKIFRRLLNTSVLNAYIMFAGSNKRQNKPDMTHREFRYNLAKSLVDRHRTHAELPRLEPLPINNTELRLRTDIIHKPRAVNDNKQRRHCTMCYRRDKTSRKIRSYCETCDSFLCLQSSCWDDWHLKPDVPHLARPRGRKRARESEE